MLTIRFARIGKRNKAQFRIILQEKAKSPKAAAAEILGFFNPHKNGDFSLKKERIQYWLSKGAKPSATVHNLLVKEGLLTGKKMRVVGGKKKKEQAAPVGTETKAEEKPAEKQEEKAAPAKQS